MLTRLPWLSLGKRRSLALSKILPRHLLKIDRAWERVSLPWVRSSGRRSLSFAKELPQHLMKLERDWKHVESVQKEFVGYKEAGEKEGFSRLNEDIKQQYSDLLQKVSSSPDCDRSDLLLVFDCMCSRFSPRPFDITLLVNWFAEHNEPEASFKILDTMLSLNFEIEPKAYNLVLNQLAKKKDLARCEELFKTMRSKAIPMDAFTFCAMVEASHRAGDMDRAEQYVAAMEEEGIGAGNGVGDALVVYGALMQGYASIPAIFLCIQVMNRVQDKGLQPNAYLHTCLINAYSRAKEYENCEKAFYKMLRTKTLPTVVTLNALLAARTQALQDGYPTANIHKCKDVFKLFTQFGLIPDVFTYGTLMKAHISNKEHNLHYVARGCLIMLQRRKLTIDRPLYCTLIRMFSLSQCSTEAVLLYADMLTHGISPDIHAYNAVMWAVATKGHNTQCRLILRSMESNNVTPDLQTCLALLQCCASSRGMLCDRATEIIQMMKELDIEPNMKAYSLLLITFARSGRVQDCIRILDSLIEEGKVVIECELLARLIRIFVISKRIYQAQLMVTKARSIFPVLDDELRTEVEKFEAWKAALNAGTSTVEQHYHLGEEQDEDQSRNSRPPSRPNTFESGHRVDNVFSPFHNDPNMRCPKLS